jgi:small subunit ribosomal protein S6
MRQYETVFLISPNLEEEETEKVISQISDIISKKKGKLIQEDRWGKKKLAYPIKKFDEAFYVFFHYEGDSNIPFELEKRFKQTEAILRFLTVKKEARENVRKKRKGIPAEEEAAAPVEEEGIEAPLEDKAEMMEEEKARTPAEEKESLVSQEKEIAKKEKEEIEEEKKEEVVPEEMMEVAAEEREEPEEARKKEKEKPDKKKEEDQEDLDSAETSKEDK